MEKKKLFSALASLLGAGAGLYWCLYLRLTDSFYSVYVAVTILGFGCWLLRLRTHRKAAGLTLVFALLLSFLVLLANLRLFDPVSGSMRPANRYYWARAGIFYLGGCFLFWQILALLAERVIVNRSTDRCDASPEYGPGFLLSFGILAAVYLLVFSLCYYPGVLTYDSVYQLQQILGQTPYTNHHPYFYTRFIGLCYQLGLALFGDVNAAVATYSVISILLMSAGFAYSVDTVGLSCRRKWVSWTVLGCYALLPYHILYSFAMWKDIFFAASVLLFTLSFYRAMKGLGRHKKTDKVLLVLSAFLMCLTRSNGKIALALSLVVFLPLFWRGRKKLCLALCGAALAGFICTGPVMQLFNVPQPRFTESLSIPLQQIAKVVSDGCPLTEEETALLSQIMDLEQVPKVYKSYISDPIKGITDTAAIEQSKGTYLKLYLGLLRKYPLQFVSAWVDQTKGYWNGGYSYWHFPAPFENDLGISITPPVEEAKAAFIAWEQLVESSPVLKLTLSIGAGTWIFLTALYLGLLKRDPVALFLPVPVLAVIATLLIATPVYAEFRYAYSLFCVLPFLLAVTL